MSKKNVKISSEFLSLVVGFVLGFLISFAISWNTIVYIIGIIMDK
jgi:hypothetical protein